ncbi:CaiB/BaiF CoA-transferase family protein [Sphingobium sp.]|uniref:CaiB/BaiF CoA-transferase family protein n=1 Tax=Sphingobium sp. TaxID=1912891 RepID=UPI0028BE7237|nr:CoA transferase [Sphingobium sp.]
MTVPRALDGIRVIDFGQYLAGPLTAMILADNGADVIRVDPPTGPRWHHSVNTIVQRGKRSIALDLKNEQDLGVAMKLIAGADVVIEGFRPGVMDRLQLGPAAMTKANPELIYASLPGFGKDDPRAHEAGWEGIIGAATGHFAPGSVLPTVGATRIAEFSPLPLASVFAAFIALNAITSALIARERDGLGQTIEVPLYNAMFELIGITGQRAAEPPRKWRHAAMDIHTKTSDDRWILISLQADRHYRWFAKEFFPQDWIHSGWDDPTRLRRDGELALQVREQICQLVRTKSADVWERDVARIGVPVGICQSTREWLQDSQAHSSGAITKVVDPELGTTLQAGFPFSMSLTPPRVGSARHSLDADRQEILRELEANERLSEVSRVAVNEQASQSALDGLRVLDLTTVVAGPTAGRILAEYGASVTKINQPNYYILCHLHASSGKDSVLLDISVPEGKEVLWRLVEQADVLIHNMPGDAPARLGISEGEIRQRRPDIIYCSIDTYGPGGPRQGRRGYEPFGQAATGLLCRSTGGGPPIYKFAVCDFGTGELAASAILLALYHRMRSGQGQHVRASLVQTATFLQIPFMLRGETEANDDELEVPPFAENANRIYKCLEGWVYVYAPEAEDNRRLHAATGVGDGDQAGLERVFAGESSQKWVSRLRAVGIAALSVATVEEAMEDERAKKLGLSVVRFHPDVGEVRLTGPASRLSRTPVKLTAPTSLPGTGTQKVIDELGLSDSFSELLASGAVAERLPEDIIVLL